MLGLADISWPSLAIGALGLIGLVSTALIVVLGSRSRLLADQQDKAIDAMNARLDAVEAENADLRRRAGLDAALLRERDARVTSLEAQVRTLKDVVTARDAIETLAGQVADGHQRILAAIAQGRT
jgi:cell division protein FtsB